METDDGIANAYRQSMEIVEETLSKLKQTVCNWPTTIDVDFEPQKSMTIKHLEQMLSYLKTPTEGDGEEAEGENHETEGNELQDSAEHPGVRCLN